MPKYWQCLLLLFCSIWIPVITMKKSVANFPLQAYFPWDSPSSFPCYIVVPAAAASWTLSGIRFFWLVLLPRRLFCFTNFEHWFLLALPSCSSISQRDNWGILCCTTSLKTQIHAILVYNLCNVSCSRFKHVECSSKWSDTLIHLSST